MKAVYIYGPPATGKFVIAQEIAKLTRFKVIDNHIFTPILLTLFESKNKHYWKLTTLFKNLLIEEAIKSHVLGIVFTGVYDGKNDDKTLKKFIHELNRKNVKTFFVRVNCSEKERLKRIVHPQRKKIGKIHTFSQLQQRMHKDIFSTVPFQQHLFLDTTSTSAKVNAKKIINYYHL